MKIEQEYFYQYPLNSILVSFSFFLIVAFILWGISAVTIKKALTEEEINELTSGFLISLIVTLFISFFICIWLLYLPSSKMLPHEKVTTVENLSLVTNSNQEKGYALIHNKMIDNKKEKYVRITSLNGTIHQIPIKNLEIQYVKTNNPKLITTKLQYKPEIMRFLYPEYIDESKYKYSLKISKKDIIRN